MSPPLVDFLSKLLSFPTVSTLPRHLPDMAACRQFLCDYLSRLGFSVQELPGDTHPAIFAQLSADPALPTVLIYGHYDVQPVDPVKAWDTPPFSPVIKEGKIYARGATDNKGQLAVHLLAAQNLIPKSNSRLPLNFKFYIEGEEEIGSPSVSAHARKYSRLLSADYLIVSDTEMPRPGQPAIHTRLRGLVYTEVRLTTAAHDAHSGQFGGVIPNPAVILAGIISRLKSSSGRILVPGFYSKVTPPTRQELADFAGLEPAPADILSESSAYALGGGEPKFSLNERRWTRPTMDVSGFLSGFTDTGPKTIIPSTAMAKISFRLVPNQVPDEIFASFSQYITSLVPPQIKLEIINHASALPYVAPTSHPVFALAKSCLQSAFGKNPVFYATGGSIGAIPILVQALGHVPCLMIAMGNTDDNLHAPNEHFSLENLAKGTQAMTDFYSRLKDLKTL